MNVIGKRVKELRERKKWTQEQLTAKCNLIELNISRGTLAKIESGVRRITDIEVELLSRALEVEVNELFEFSDE